MADRFLHIDAKEAEAIIHQLRSDYPELADDDELRFDMIEGETDLENIVARAVKEYKMADAFAIGLTGYIKELQDRKGRFEKKQEAMKRLIKSLMESAGADKIPLPDATVFVTEPRTKVEVLNLDELPQGYFKLTKTADKAGLKKTLEAGEAIPGAELVLGDSGLTIRTK